jgi:hypothetical protein
MGVNIASSEFSAIGWLRKPHLHVLRRVNPFRKRYREFLRARSSFDLFATSDYGQNSLQFGNTGEQFRSVGYTYGENFLAKDLYLELLNGFPSRKFFDPFYDLTKTYDWGFVKKYGSVTDPHDLEKFPSLKKFYDFVASDVFCGQVTELCGDGIVRKCHTIDSTWAKSGGYLTPHQDQAREVDKSNGFVNLVYFVKGNGDPWTGGGTSFSSDAEMSELLLTPRTLNNSFVIYRSLANVWHGFRTIGRGQVRWAIIVQFCSSNYSN